MGGAWPRRFRTVWKLCGGDGRTRLKVLRCTRQDYIDLAVCIVCFALILSSRLVFPNF